MATRPTVTVVELPKPPREARNGSKWTNLVQKLRALRLRGLQTAPEAFASTYEAESQRGLDQTFDRLSSPKARHFVAVEDDQAAESVVLHEGDVASIDERAWVGMVVLLGPMGDAVTARGDPFRRVAGGNGGDGAPSTTMTEGQRTPPAEFVLNGVFVEPSTRGCGVGKALIDTALEQARGQGVDSGTGTYVTVLVNADNGEARKLYEKARFVVVGEETYTQQPRALLGEGETSEKVALKMRLDVA